MKLRPLEEAAGDMVLIEYAEASRKLQADREATVARDAEIAMSTIRAAMADPRFATVVVLPTPPF